MNLETLYQCNSGNTESANVARQSDLLVKIDGDMFRVVDFSLTVAGTIVLLVSEV